MTSTTRWAASGTKLTIDLQDEFVVDLEEHPGRQLGFVKARRAHHRDLHDVGRGALHRHVDRHPLGGGRPAPFAEVRSGRIAPPAAERLHVAVAAPKARVSSKNALTLGRRAQYWSMNWLRPPGSGRYRAKVRMPACRR